MDGSRFILEECSPLNIDEDDLHAIQQALIDHVHGEYPDSDGDLACEFIEADAPLPKKKHSADGDGDVDGAGRHDRSRSCIGQKRRQATMNGGGGGGGDPCGSGSGYHNGDSSSRDSSGGEDDDNGHGDDGEDDVDVIIRQSGKRMSQGSSSRRPSKECTTSTASWEQGGGGGGGGGERGDCAGGTRVRREDDLSFCDDDWNRTVDGVGGSGGSGGGGGGGGGGVSSSKGGNRNWNGNENGTDGCSFMELSDDCDDDERGRFIDEATFMCEMCKSGSLPLRLVYPMAHCSCLFCKSCVEKYAQSYIDERRREWEVTIQEWRNGGVGGDHHHPRSEGGHNANPNSNLGGGGGGSGGGGGDGDGVNYINVSEGSSSGGGDHHHLPHHHRAIMLGEEIPCPNAQSQACGGFLSLQDCQEVAPAAARRWCETATEVLLSCSGFVRCPNPDCHVVIERIEGAPPMGVAPCGVPEIDRTMPFAEIGEDGKPLTRDALLHRARNRYRCSLCQIVFCGKCLSIPYHLGESCEDHCAAKCCYCDEKLSTPTAEVLGSGSDCTSVSAAQARRDGVGVYNWSAMSVKLLKREVEKRRVDMSWCVEKADLVEVLQFSDTVCGKSDCRAKLESACTRKLQCGHRCGGIQGEARCLPCLQGSCQTSRGADGGSELSGVLPSADDLCPICMAEPLKKGPVIKLVCGHVVHRQCAVDKVKAGYPGPAISFGFLDCPLCSLEMAHPALDRVMEKPRQLKRAVRRKALRQLEMNMALHEIEELKPGGRFEGCREQYAMRTYQYYICAKCQKPYFGGERACGDAVEQREGGEGGEEERQGGGDDPALPRFWQRANWWGPGGGAGGREEEGDEELHFWQRIGPRNWFGQERRGANEQERDNRDAAGGRGEQGRNRYNAADLVCGGCSSGARSSGHCKAVHGNEYVQYKCRYCCSIASFFCWGKTHFCENCHEKRPDIHHSLMAPRCRGAKYCPLGVSHPPHGTEFCLGCALCRFKGS